MYKYANDLLPPALNCLYTPNSDIHNYITMSIRVKLTLTQTVLVTQVLAYGMFFSQK